MTRYLVRLVDDPPPTRRPCGSRRRTRHAPGEWAIVRGDVGSTERLDRQRDARLRPGRSTIQR